MRNEIPPVTKALFSERNEKSFSQPNLISFQFIRASIVHSTNNQLAVLFTVTEQRNQTTSEVIGEI